MIPRIKIEAPGVERLIRANTTFRTQLPRAIKDGMRGEVNAARGSIAQRLERESSMGRRVFTGKSGEALAQVQLVDVRTRGDVIETGVGLRGVAKLLEKGGQTRPHPIESRTGGRVFFFGSRVGRLIGVTRAQHPGGRVKAYGAAEAELGAAAPKVTNSVGASVRQLIRSIFGNG